MTKLQMSIQIASALLNVDVEETNWKVKDLMKSSKLELESHMKMANKVNAQRKMTISDILFSSPCKENGLCCNPSCKTAVAQFHKTGKWFITFGHAGFNSPTNNANGYQTKDLALRSMNWYLNKSNYGKEAKC